MVLELMFRGQKHWAMAVVLFKVLENPLQLKSLYKVLTVGTR